MLSALRAHAPTLTSRPAASVVLPHVTRAGPENRPRVVSLRTERCDPGSRAPRPALTLQLTSHPRAAPRLPVLCPFQPPPLPQRQRGPAAPGCRVQGACGRRSGEGFAFRTHVCLVSTVSRIVQWRKAECGLLTDTELCKLEGFVCWLVGSLVPGECTPQMCRHFRERNSSPIEGSADSVRGAAWPAGQGAPTGHLHRGAEHGLAGQTPGAGRPLSPHGGGARRCPPRCLIPHLLHSRPARPKGSGSGTGYRCGFPHVVTNSEHVGIEDDPMPR